MKRGSLIKLIHVNDLMDKRDSGWKIAVYLGKEHLPFHRETIKVIDSDGRINNYPIDAFYFSEFQQ